MNFLRHANILRSDCGTFEVIKMHLHTGNAYAAYRLMAPGLDLPELLAVEPTSAKAIEVCTVSQRYGGAP
jgi:hypothetical protein